MDRFVHDDTQAETAVSRPVTDRSRITGVDRSGQAEPAGDPVGSRSRGIDWAAVMASVVSGLAITTMLIILGVSTGLIAGNEGTSADEAQGILGAIGAWTVVAACIGTFIGSLLGGRLARWLDRGSLGYHALTSWGLATLLSLVLLTLVSIGFATTTNSAANTTTAAETTTEGDAAAGDPAGADPAATPEGQTGENANTAAETADDAADALGGAGLAISLGMLLTLAVSVAGWWVGSRKRLLDIEREPAH